MTHALTKKTIQRFRPSLPHVKKKKNKTKQNNQTNRLDRSGKRDAKTAKMFYVSSVFVEVLNQFNPISEDMGSKQRYAAWRAGRGRLLTPRLHILNLRRIS